MLSDTRKRFDEMWGEAPNGSLKYEKGEAVKQFLQAEIKRALEEVVPKEVVSKEDPYYNERISWISWVSFREELQKNIDNFLKK